MCIHETRNCICTGIFMSALFGDDDHSIWIRFNADNPASFSEDDCLDWIHNTFEIIKNRLSMEQSPSITGKSLIAMINFFFCSDQFHPNRQPLRPIVLRSQHFLHRVNNNLQGKPLHIEVHHEMSCILYIYQ